MTPLEQKIWELILKQKEHDIDIKSSKYNPNETKFFITPEIEVIGRYPITDKENCNTIGYENYYIAINDNIFYTDQSFFYRVADIATERNDRYVRRLEDSLEFVQDAIDNISLKSTLKI